MSGSGSWRATDLIAEALWLFRRDSALLLGLAGVFWLLPAFALALLVPPAPVLPESAARGTPEATAAVAAYADWLLRHGGWYLIGIAIATWGSASVFALYFDRDRPDLRAAIARGAGLWPRFALLHLLVGAITAAGLLLWIVPGIYLFGRLLPAAPMLVAERTGGVLATVGRAFRATRGRGLALAGVAAAILAVRWLLPEPLWQLDQWLRAQAGGANPVALATVDLLVGVAVALAWLSATLLAVAVYRRLASRPV